MNALLVIVLALAPMIWFFGLQTYLHSSERGRLPPLIVLALMAIDTLLIETLGIVLLIGGRKEILASVEAVAVVLLVLPFVVSPILARRRR